MKGRKVKITFCEDLYIERVWDSHIDEHLWDHDWI